MLHDIVCCEYSCMYMYVFYTAVHALYIGGAFLGGFPRPAVYEWLDESLYLEYLPSSCHKVDSYMSSVFHSA